MLLTYITRRLMMMIPVVIGVTILVFLMLRLGPGDPVRVILGEYYSDETAAALRAELDLDKPLPVQYLLWLEKLVRGDFGRTYDTREQVSDLIISRLGTTYLLTFGSMIVALCIAIPSGVLSALKRGTWIDILSRLFSVIGMSMPVFVWGIILLIVFALFLNWLPPGGNVKEFGFSALILPSICLGTAFAALTARMTRSSMIDVLNQDYIRTARAKGLSSFKVYFKHALKNALIPVVTVALLQLGGMLGGAVLTETVFNIPGLGRLLVEGIYRRDYRLVQGVILVISISFVLVNLIADISYVLLDPRISYDKKR